MEYRNGSKSQKPIVLVGKGVTFDTGGINLKPSDGILGMHMDMSGGAAVIHSVVLAAKLKLKTNVVGLIPAVENMPSGSSYRPGDVLTSMYFSFVYSHTRSANVFDPADEQVEQWESEGIDKFVLSFAEDRFDRFRRLCSALIDKPNVILLKYEDMVTHFPEWLHQFLRVFYQLDLSEQNFTVPEKFIGYHRQLYEIHKNDFTREEENIKLHIRQITPGDHKRKLTPETIEQLNHIGRDVLELLNYDIVDH